MSCLYKDHISRLKPAYQAFVIKLASAADDDVQFISLVRLLKIDPGWLVYFNGETTVLKQLGKQMAALPQSIKCLCGREMHAWNDLNLPEK